MSLNATRLAAAMTPALTAGLVAAGATPAGAATLAAAIASGVSAAVVAEITANATLTVPGTGLVAPSGGGAVTGSSVTGSIA